MNKILAHVILKSFSFNFIKKKKNVPTFPEFGFYVKIKNNFQELDWFIFALHHFQSNSQVFRRETTFCCIDNMTE